jgi:hypothetical protein
MILNRQCDYAGEVLPFTWENVQVQARCSVEHLSVFLQALKQHNLYDSSLIIVHADHGYWKLPGSKSQVELRNLDATAGTPSLNEEEFAQIVSSSAPLLAIKLPNASGPLTTSTAPAAISDLPATISAALNLGEPFGGKPVFQIGPRERRERRFFYYYDLNREGDQFFDRFDEYVVTGRLRDRAAWRLAAPRHSREDAGAQRIAFGTDRTLRILREGWSAHEFDDAENGAGFNWAIGRAASLTASLPKTRVKLRARVKTPFGDQEQSVTVSVDGKSVGTWQSAQAWTWEDHELFIDADENRPAASDIQFEFSSCREPGFGESRCLAVAFESITLESPGD